MIKAIYKLTLIITFIITTMSTVAIGGSEVALGNAEECARKTNGVGVFHFIVHNNLDVDRNVRICIEAPAIGGKAAGSKNVIEVKAHSTTTTIICKPFFGESYDDYKDTGPELLGATKILINDGAGLGLKRLFFYKGYIPDTKIVDIDDITITINR